MSEQELKGEEREEYEEERKRREIEKQKREDREKGRAERPGEAEIPAKLSTKGAIEPEVSEGARVPILELEKPRIDVKDVGLSKEVPRVEREKLEVEVPVIKLSPPVFEEREIELKKDIPSVKTAEKEAIKVPLIKLRKFVVRSVISKFDSTIPSVRPRPPTRVRIPIYRISRLPAVKEAELLDEKVDEKLLEKLEEQKSATEIQRPQIRTVSGEVEPSPGEGMEIEEEPPEFLQFVFGGHSTKVLARGPIIALYRELENDSTIGSFERLCIRIFREKRGGEPSYFSIRNFDQYNIREIEKYIKPEGNIVRIDLDALKRSAEKERIDIFKMISPERFRELLDRFIVGDVSFLVFKSRDEKLYNHCKQVLSHLFKYMEHTPRLVEVFPRELTFEQKKVLTELTWGVSVEGAGMIVNKDEWDRPLGYTLDDLFRFGELRRGEKMENIQREKGGLYVLATKEHEGKESDLHLQIKWFIVRLLSKKYGLKSLSEIERCIKTEEQLGEGGPKPDVWDVEKNVVYEVETLFSKDGEGSTPQRKIYDTIRKYEGTPIEEINVVLDNLTFLSHIRDILGIKKNIREWENNTGKTVNFLTLDIETGKLVTIDEVLRKYTSLTKGE